MHPSIDDFFQADTDGLDDVMSIRKITRWLASGRLGSTPHSCCGPSERPAYFLNPLCGRVFLWLHFRKTASRTSTPTTRFLKACLRKTKHRYDGRCSHQYLKKNRRAHDLARRVRGKSPCSMTTIGLCLAGVGSMLSGLGETLGAKSHG